MNALRNMFKKPLFSSKKRISPYSKRVLKLAPKTKSSSSPPINNTSLQQHAQTTSLETEKPYDAYINAV